MSIQPSLFADDSFREDCRLSTVPAELLELGYCYHCHHIAKLSGGLCSDCADPIKEDDEEDVSLPKVKVPRSREAGREKLRTGLDAGLRTEPTPGPESLSRA